MTKVLMPEDILPDGDDHTVAINPFTGFQGKARKGTVAATLQNIALLDRLLKENANEDHIAQIKKAIIELLPSLKAVGIFNLFTPHEWISNPSHPGRTFAALLYLKYYPEEKNEKIIQQLQVIKECSLNLHLLSEL